MISVAYQLLAYKPTYELNERIKKVVDDCFEKYVIDESHGLTYAEYQGKTLLFILFGFDLVFLLNQKTTKQQKKKDLNNNKNK